MKKILFYLSIAVFAFALSFGGIYIFNFFSRIPAVELSDEVYYFSGCGDGLGKVDIEYKYTIRDKDFNNGVFMVTNLTDAPIYYTGDEKKNYADSWIRQNGKATLGIICRFGMAEQKLNPFESAIFEITIPKNKKPFAAGFDFYAGFGSRLETIWVEVDKQRVFAEQPGF